MRVAGEVISRRGFLGLAAGAVAASVVVLPKAATEDLIVCDPTSGRVTINLPAASADHDLDALRYAMPAFPLMLHRWQPELSRWVAK